MTLYPHRCASGRVCGTTLGEKTRQEFTRKGSVFVQLHFRAHVGDFVFVAAGLQLCACERMHALSGVPPRAGAAGLVCVVGGLKARGEGGGAWVCSGASSLHNHSAT